MEKVKQTKTAKFNVDELVELIYDTATGCYGIVGICDKDIDGKKANPLEKNRAKKGIIFNGSIDKGFTLSIYVILSSEVKISESIRECQKAIRYVANKKANHKCEKVDIYAMAII